MRFVLQTIIQLKTKMHQVVICATPMPYALVGKTWLHVKVILEQIHHPMSSLSVLMNSHASKEMKRTHLVNVEPGMRDFYAAHANQVIMFLTKLYAVNVQMTAYCRLFTSSVCFGTLL